MSDDYLPARCTCGAGIAGTMITDSRPWYACGTIAGRACIAEPDRLAPVAIDHALRNLVGLTWDERQALAALAAGAELPDLFPDHVRVYSDGTAETIGGPNVALAPETAGTPGAGIDGAPAPMSVVGAPSYTFGVIDETHPMRHD